MMSTSRVVLQLLPGRPLCVCVCVCVCVNAQHKFRGWVTILGHVSCHIHFFYIKSYLGTHLTSSGPDKYRNVDDIINRDNNRDKTIVALAVL